LRGLKGSFVLFPLSLKEKGAVLFVAHVLRNFSGEVLTKKGKV